MDRKILFIGMLFLFIPLTASVAQKGLITGTITDIESGETIPGANILILDLELGAISGLDGEFVIENVPAGTHTLHISFVGYQTFTQTFLIEADETKMIDAELRPIAIGLDEIVVTGYGELSERNFTGSVSQVRSEMFEDVPVSSINQALIGRVTGMNISPATGTPGAVQDVRIRGISSINADASPLYVIDGIPIISGNNAKSTATSSLDILANISSSDIESVTVLKDAASTALYGARGSNGVIVIKTKEGRPGDVEYSFNVQRGYNERAVGGPGTLSAQEWDRLFVDSYNNAFGTDFQYGGELSGWDGQTNTNWRDVVRNEGAVQQEYQIAVRGGNESTTFYASTGFFEEEGEVIGSGLQRYSGKINIDHQFDNSVRFSNHFSGSFVEQDGILEGPGYFGSPIMAEFCLLPIDSAYTAAGQPNIKNLNSIIFNPVYIQQMDIDRKRNSRLINNSQLSIDILNNLSFNTHFSIDYILTEEKYYDNPFYGDGETVRGSVADVNTRNFNYVWRNALNYIFEPAEDQLLDLRVIFESQKNYNNYLEAYGEGIAAAGLYHLNTVASPKFVGSRQEDWGVQSFIGLVNYRLNNRFIVDGSLRHEGNSRFAEENRWGTFWSLGIGYILSEEEFLQHVKWLNFLRLRTSYGVTGNAAIGLNKYQTLVGFGGYNDQPNIQPAQLGNPSLTWEKARSFDLSLDFEAIGAIDGSFTFFHKNSFDLLFDTPLSRTSGHSSQIRNVGELYNRGFEIEISADIIRTQNFTWSLGGNYTSVKNKITQLPEDPNGNPIEISEFGRYRAVEGYEVDAWFMKEWAGVDPETGDPLWYMNNGNGGRTTTNNYNDADEYYQNANAQPRHYGGLNTRINIHGFFIRANVSYAFGYKIYDNPSQMFMSGGNNAFNAAIGQYRNQADYWQKPGDHSKNPRPVLFTTNQANETSSRFLHRGDHLRLQSLNIGFQIPQRYIRKAGLRSATLYFTGRNLLTHVFDEDLEWDPQQKVDGFTDLNAQPIRSLAFGVKANF